MLTLGRKPPRASEDQYAMAIYRSVGYLPLAFVLTAGVESVGYLSHLDDELIKSQQIVTEFT
jgi:hypothetical protein